MAHGVTLKMKQIKRPSAVAVHGPGPEHQVTGRPVNIHKVLHTAEPAQPRAIRRVRKLQARIQRLLAEAQ